MNPLLGKREFGIKFPVTEGRYAHEDMRLSEVSARKGVHASP